MIERKRALISVQVRKRFLRFILYNRETSNLIRGGECMEKFMERGILTMHKCALALKKFVLIILFYNYQERRNGKGHFRGRGRYRGTDRYVRGNESRAFDDGNNQNRNYKGVRGRGPRRYEPPAKNKEMPAILDKR